MEGIMFGGCLSFSCLAGECPSSCCIGWQIVVDSVSYGRFSEISDKVLKDDIMSNIIEGKNGYYFANDRDGKCKMLDDDGLCRIQKMSSEQMLCETCRKYPRLIGSVGNGKILLSMAASCPVIAKGICGRRAVFYLFGGKDGKKLTKIYYKDLQYILGNEFKSLNEYVCLLKEGQALPDNKYPDWFLVYRAMLLLVDKCVDLMEEFSEYKYLDESFIYFGNEVPLGQVMSDLAEYHREMGSIWTGEGFVPDINKKVSDNNELEWEGLAANYWEYRQFTRFLGRVHEAVYERDMQVVGELFLMYTVGFSRYISGKGCNIKLWNEHVAWVYRFCAHGFKMENKLHNFFVEFGMELLNGFCVVMDKD